MDRLTAAILLTLALSIWALWLAFYWLPRVVARRKLFQKLRDQIADEVRAEHEIYRGEQPSPTPRRGRIGETPRGLAVGEGEGR